MRLNRTGRKFAVFYVAVTLTIFVGLELDRIPLTFVHVLATKVFVMLALLWWALNHWVFVLTRLSGQILGVETLTRMPSEYTFLTTIPIGAPLYFCLGWICGEIAELLRRRFFPDPPPPRGDDPRGWQPR